MKALLIEVDFRTGKRAGGAIQTKNNPNLMCHGWQKGMDSNLVPSVGLELRLVMDGNTKPYENIPGITILSGKAEINAAIDANFPTRYAVKDSYLMREAMKEQGIPLTIFDNKNMEQTAQEAFARNLAGVIERKSAKVQ